MGDYNASDLRSIRKASKETRALAVEHAGVVLNLMSSPAGRSWMHARLTRCHVFSSSFSQSALSTAFSEGERNIGLQDLNDIMRWAPDQYIQMMREATDKELSNGRRTDDSTESGRGPANGRGDDSGPEPLVDYDPVAGLDIDNGE